MTQALIRRAFEGALSTWAAAQTPAIPVAWENVEFRQPAGRYLRAFLLPALTDSQDLGRVHRRYSGVFQVSVVMPTGTGAGAAEAIVGALATLFAPATPIVVSGLSVWASQPLSTGPAIPDGDRFVIPCSVPYLADTF